MIILFVRRMSPKAISEMRGNHDSIYILFPYCNVKNDESLHKRLTPYSYVDMHQDGMPMMMDADYNSGEESNAAFSPESNKFDYDRYDRLEMKVGNDKPIYARFRRTDAREAMHYPLYDSI